MIIIIIIIIVIIIIILNVVRDPIVQHKETLNLPIFYLFIFIF